MTALSHLNSPGAQDGRERAAFYGRFSSLKQKKASIVDQFRNCQEACDDHGWLVLPEYHRSDPDKTGTTLFGRKGILELIELVKQEPRPFDTLVIDESSRLGRRMADVFHLLDIFDFYGVKVYFAGDDLMSGTEWFRDAFTAKARADEQFSKTHGKRVRRGRIGRFDAGLNPGGGCYGYKNEKVFDITRRGESGEPQVIGKKQVKGPEEAKIVRRIWNSYADGMSCRQIRTMLNDEGVPPPQSTRKNSKPSWSVNAILTILSNDRYRGLVTYGRTIEVRNPETGRTERRDVPEAQWRKRVDVGLQIINDELYERVQERRNRFKQKLRVQQTGGMSRTEASRKYLLSGLLRCGVCEGNFVIRTSKPARYQCANHVNRGTCPNRATIRQDELESGFVRVLVDHLASADNRDHLVQSVFDELQSNSARLLAAAGEAEQQRKELEDNLRNLIVHQKNLTTAVKESGGIPALYAELSDVGARIARLEEILASPRKSVVEQMSIDEVREFVNGEIQQLEQLLMGSPGSLKEEFQKRITEIVLTPTEDERGAVYRVTGDVGLFRSVPKSVVQTNQVHQIGLHYTFAVSFEIACYKNRQSLVPDGELNEVYPALPDEFDILPLTPEQLVQSERVEQSRLGITQAPHVTPTEPDSSTEAGYSYAGERLEPTAGDDEAIGGNQNSNVPSICLAPGHTALAADAAATQNCGGRAVSIDDYPSQELFSVPATSMANYDREQVYADVWEMPMWKAAKKHRVSEDTLRAVCGRLYVPTPGSGHWSKVAAGKATGPKPLLPPVTVRPTASRDFIQANSEAVLESSCACSAAPQTDDCVRVPSRLARYSRERLHEQVWKSPIRKLAPEYGVSDTTLRKDCRRLVVPLPPKDYFSKLAAGKQVPERPPLPPIQITELPAHTRVYTADERKSVLAQVAQLIASGQTLAAACRRTGILEKKYRRWFRQQPTLAPPDVRTTTAESSMDQASPESTTTKSLPKVSAKLLRTHDRKKLHVEVWSMPLPQVAKQYGVSAVTIWWRCKKLQVPTPPPGHFLRLASGMPVQQRPALPEIEIIDESKKEWKTNVYLLAVITAKLGDIGEARSRGKTLGAACRDAGIAITTYRRWRKHLLV